MLPRLPADARVFVCTRATDMRKSFDGLLRLVHKFLVGRVVLSRADHTIDGPRTP
jgi:hypothetical protein